MRSLLSTFILLSLDTFTSAVPTSPILRKPFKRNNNSTTAVQWLPSTYAALGDSYAAGFGAGAFLNSSSDGLDNVCGRSNGSYPFQMVVSSDAPFNPTEPLWKDFYACSGAKLEDMDGQIQRLGNKTVDVVSLQVGGNNFHFSDIVKACIYNLDPFKTEEVAQKECSAVLDQAQGFLNDTSYWDAYRGNLTRVYSEVLGNKGLLVVLGYAHFFPPNATAGDECDNFPTKWSILKSHLPLRAANRLRMNDLVTRVNLQIELAVHRLQFPVIDSTDNRVPNMAFMPIDELFSGHRFCESINAADPMNATDSNIWFNELNTPLLTDDVAWDGPYGQAKGSPGADIHIGALDIDILPSAYQEIHTMHPKAEAHAQITRALIQQIRRMLGDENAAGPLDTYSDEKQGYAQALQPLSSATPPYPSTYAQLQPSSTYAQLQPSLGYAQPQSSSSYAQLQPSSTYAQLQPSSTYGQPQPLSTYAQPWSAYASPASSYASPASAYASPASAYASPASAYAQPPSEYAQPWSTYASPVSTYGQPLSSYAAAPMAPGSPYATLPSNGSLSSPMESEADDALALETIPLPSATASATYNEGTGMIADEDGSEMPAYAVGTDNVLTVMSTTTVVETTLALTTVTPTTSGVTLSTPAFAAATTDVNADMDMEVDDPSVDNWSSTPTNASFYAPQNLTGPTAASESQSQSYTTESEDADTEAMTLTSTPPTNNALFGKNTTTADSQAQALDDSNGLADLEEDSSVDLAPSTNFTLSASNLTFTNSETQTVDESSVDADAEDDEAVNPTLTLSANSTLSASNTTLMTSNAQKFNESDGLADLDEEASVDTGLEDDDTEAVNSTVTPSTNSSLSGSNSTLATSNAQRLNELDSTIGSDEDQPVDTGAEGDNTDALDLAATPPTNSSLFAPNSTLATSNTRMMSLTDSTVGLDENQSVDTSVGDDDDNNALNTISTPWTNSSLSTSNSTLATANTQRLDEVESPIDSDGSADTNIEDDDTEALDLPSTPPSNTSFVAPNSTLTTTTTKQLSDVDSPVTPDPSEDMDIGIDDSETSDLTSSPPTNSSLFASNSTNELPPSEIPNQADEEKDWHSIPNVEGNKPDEGGVDSSNSTSPSLTKTLFTPLNVTLERARNEKLGKANETLGSVDDELPVDPDPRDADEIGLDDEENDSAFTEPAQPSLPATAGSPTPSSTTTLLSTRLVQASPNPTPSSTTTVLSTQIVSAIPVSATAATASGADDENLGLAFGATTSVVVAAASNTVTSANGMPTLP